MRAISIIFRRELGSYLRSPVGYIIAALVLLCLGIMFQAYALGAGKAYSADVLRKFFEFSSGGVIIAAIALSIRLLAEERQQHTLVLLNTSPVRDWEIVTAKFLSAYVFLSGIILASFYMPLLIMVEGKISTGEVLVGYLGLLLIGGAALAIGVFASSIAKQQIFAAVLGAVICILLVMLFPLAKRIDAPLSTVFQNLDLWYIHFRDGFMRGILNLKDVVYYLAVIYFFLLLATKTLEARRWQ